MVTGRQAAALEKVTMLGPVGASQSRMVMDQFWPLRLSVMVSASFWKYTVALGALSGTVAMVQTEVPPPLWVMLVGLKEDPPLKLIHIFTGTELLSGPAAAT